MAATVEVAADAEVRWEETRTPLQRPNLEVLKEGGNAALLLR